MTEFTFQTRARTIDHLGREQIADVPTAISELWKNAYDAYAREVSLHIFAGQPATAAILDDGTGMSREQFVQNWLVVGTESKVRSEEVPASQRQGLLVRPRQGQKGIGRLSVAALGASVLVVSKTETAPFVASLIDWRLFENPFLFLTDVKIPVVEFATPSELVKLLPGLRESLTRNLDGAGADSETAERIQAAWQSYDQLDGTKDGTNVASSAIRQSIESGVPNTEHLDEWSVWTGKKPNGTALVMSELNSALLAWTLAGEASDREESGSIRDSLRRTLVGFSDPYVEGDDEVMNYEVVVHTSEGKKTILSREDGYGLDFLRTLDHCVEGKVDENGIFKGKVRAFGKDIGIVELIPAQLPPTSPRDHIGPFSIAIGAFEPIARSSTLTASAHGKVVERAQTNSGLAIYRDGLRVMPYGRPENDFFKIEERRQMHAGREFWASRRLFGRIAISRQGNPNLRDKAGREGLIDNTSSRALQILVKDLLRTTARRYFGSDSPLREEILPNIEAENDAAALKAKTARAGQVNNFRKMVREQTPALDDAETKIASLAEDLDAAAGRDDPEEIWRLSERINEVVTLRSDLRLPPKPKNLGNFEDRYRQYRDRYMAMATKVDEVRSLWAEHSERLKATPPIEIARSHLGRTQQAVSERLVRWRRGIEDILKGEAARLDAQIDQDLKEFYKIVAPLLQEVETGRMTLPAALNEMDDVRERLTRQFGELYDPYLRALTQLSQGVDLDSAFAYAGAREVTLERRLEQIQGLAQIGISVEILSHELSTLQRRLSASLSIVAKENEASDALTEAQAAGAELVERLRFLSQVQVAGGDARRAIRGTDIDSYLRKFFGHILEERGVSIEATKAFRNAAFQEFPSRIYPVFINLANNSLYWLAGRKEKIIRLDADDGVLKLGDTGPGVDRDDIANLFELFFTRRVRGRGVGLYLCRQTLAAGGHKIEYVTDPRNKIAPGVNFAITLRNGFDG